MAHGHDSLPPSTGSVDGDKEEYNKTKEKKKQKKQKKQKNKREKSREF
jgi:hypothetical protein